MVFPISGTLFIHEEKYFFNDVRFSFRRGYLYMKGGRTMHLPKLQIPRAFSLHHKIMEVLYATVEEFNPEEQQAIYYHYYLELSPRTISKTLELTEQHVISALGLYAERLANRINLFKRTMPHDDNDMMQASEILLPWTA